MTFLYNCKHSGDQYRITKFNSDFEVEGDSSYLCDLHNCECPAGHRPSCRHREMLPKFIQRNHVGDNWFFDFDRGGWVQGWREEPALTAQPLLVQSEQSEPAQTNQDLWLDQNEASMQSEIASSLAPEGLGQPSEQGFNAEMQTALEADGEYLRQMTGEDHGPVFLPEPSPLPSPSPTIRRRV